MFLELVEPPEAVGYFVIVLLLLLFLYSLAFPLFPFRERDGVVSDLLVGQDILGLGSRRGVVVPFSFPSRSFFER